MELVRICHPHPDVADAMVAPSAVDVWRHSGWLTEEEYAALRADAESAATVPDDKPDEPKPKTTRRRGSSDSSEEKD